MKPITEAERRDWLRLARTENVGPLTFIQLMQRYHTAGAAIEAIPELAAKGGLKRKLKVPSIASIEDEIGAIRKLGAKLIAMPDEDYPTWLRSIADPPPVISVLGHASLFAKASVALVGARNASINGIRFAEKLARDLGAMGYATVSGLAAGIDAAVHRGSLSTGTLAVVAGGIDVIYPPENEKLYRSIAEQGCIIAEMPMGFEIRPTLFPRRNRIVSGLSLGTVVIEAAMKSGSLITARLAAEQGREVMAVPGSPLDPRSAGTNHLIREGATLIQGAFDVAEALKRPLSQEAPKPVYVYQLSENVNENDVSRAVGKILNALSPTPQPVDEVIRLCETPAPVAAAALLELELAGRVARLPGNLVALLGEPDLAEAHQTG